MKNPNKISLFYRLMDILSRLEILPGKGRVFGLPHFPPGVSGSLKMAAPHLRESAKCCRELWWCFWRAMCCYKYWLRNSAISLYVRCHCLVYILAFRQLPRQTLYQNPDLYSCPQIDAKNEVLSNIENYGSIASEQTICVAGLVTQKTANFHCKDQQVTPHQGAAWRILCKALRSASVWVRRVRALFPPVRIQPKGKMTTKCECQGCKGEFEFDISDFQLNSESPTHKFGQTIPCPHCNQSTMVYMKKTGVGYFQAAVKPQQTTNWNTVLALLVIVGLIIVGGFLNIAFGTSDLGDAALFLEGLMVSAAIVFGFLIYFGPTFIACRRNKRNKQAIFILNLLTGWSFIGWVIACVWAYTKD